VLWLDWGTFGPKAQPLPDLKQLAQWLELCCDELTASCPREIRIVSFLALQVEERNHAKLEREWTGFQKKYTSELFRALLLDPLSPLKEGHLLEYLQDPSNTGYPLGGGFAIEMAELLFRRTAGNYEETVKLIDEAVATGWRALHRRLKGEDEAPPSSEDGTL
jgi:hypothetical protein